MDDRSGHTLSAGQAFDRSTVSHNPFGGNELKYRADIDGLRTVAVVPVVLYHAGLALFSGGFVGVDVFFVISGFLITGILIKDIERGRFSILEFYRRRIRRILPALVLVLGASTIAAWLFFPPDLLKGYGSSLVSVSLFASNFWFRRTVDYFATDAHLQPLLHTWSLAVEEQFYIFYPLLLYVLCRRFFRQIGTILIGLLLVSLVMAVLLLPIFPGSVFYLLPTRAWELLIGGLLAAGIARKASPGPGASLSGVLGLLLIVLPVAFYTSLTPFPGLAALPPCLGAALLIWSGAGRTGPAFRLLSSTPFVRIGQVSYSFYLWHFPIFTFAAYLLAKPIDPVTGLALALASLALSFATLFLVENPVRASRKTWAWAAPLTLTATLGALGLVLAMSSGFPGRMSAQAAAYVAVSHDENRHHSECMTNLHIVSPDDACLLGDRQAAPHVLLWGDSHAMVTATAMESAARKAGKSFLFAAAADCPQGLGFSISDTTTPRVTRLPAYRYCGEYNRKMLQRALSDPQIRTVVFSARWTNWRIGAAPNPAEEPVDIRLHDSHGVAPSMADNYGIWTGGFISLIDRLKAAGKTIYIVGPLPEPAFNVPNRYYVARFGLTSDPQSLTVSGYDRRHSRILAFFAELARREPVHFIWPVAALCSNGECPIGDAGGLRYFDQDHLSVHGAIETAPLYDGLFRANGQGQDDKRQGLVNRREGN